MATSGPGCNLACKRHKELAMNKTFNAGDYEEAYGAEVAQACLDDMLALDNQGARMERLQEALLHLRTRKHPKRAAGGFAVAMVNVIEIGLGLSK